MVPAEARSHHGFEKGRSVIFMESPWGLVITTREALLARVQSELQDTNLVEELLTERRAEAAMEDAR